MRRGPSGAAYMSCARCCAAIGAHQDGFHVLAGDFNTLAPGAVST